MVAIDDEPDVPEHRRVRYAPDEEDGLPRRTRESTFYLPSMQRTITGASTRSDRSARSGRSNRIPGKPELAIPIEYRSVSFGINDTQPQQAAELKTARGKTTAELGDVDWHVISPDELYKRFALDPMSGLSDARVQESQKQYGKNVPSPPPSHLWRRIFWYFFGGFGSILFVACILVFISWEPLGFPDPAPANLGLAVVLLVVFLVQAAFNAWQDFSSSRVMNSITGMLPDSCQVMRNGNRKEIMGAELVPGDVVYFKAGSKLPADLRFIEVSSDAKFDRSILTGESLPIAGSVDSTDENYLETRCIGMQGTHCTAGSGVGIVVSTGDKTVFGRIAKLTSTPKSGRTPLQKEILIFVLIIVSLMLFFNILVIILWLTYLRPQHPDYIDVPGLIIDLVSVAVAFIPEGLPIALTASLTIIANLMRMNNILCKSLKTVETLGSISVLLSDKTGTLTTNNMVATHFCIGDDEHAVKSSDDAEKKLDGAGIDQLRATSAICNAAEFDAAGMNLPLKDRKIIGDATDQATLRFSESIGPVADMRDMWRKRFDLAFNSKNKFMIRVSSVQNDLGLHYLISRNELEKFDKENDMVLTIKGAPDVLIGRCSKRLNSDGEVEDFDSERRSQVEALKDKWSSQGKRVILLARKVLKYGDISCDPTSGEYENAAMSAASNGLTLVGLLAIVDPPREEIPGVVTTLRRAGIRTMMVTGDFKLTAQAIARECGIITNPDSQIESIENLRRDNKELSTEVMELGGTFNGKSLVISGSEIITLNDTQWTQLCQYQEVVFARTTPEQKLRIVKEYQRRENLVGMTGDGVNDAPSLKQADIGIAPGSGSDIAIEAADMVLLDSFAAIVEAVMYGRVVFDNLKKTICYLLPAGSFSEFWPVLTSVIFGLPQVLSSFLMIIICCFTDCAAATALAYEKPEADVMLRPPRNPKKDKLVNWQLLFHAYMFIGVIETVCSFSMAYWYCERQGVPFSILWFGYGNYPAEYDPDYIAGVLNTASSIYFVNLVVMQWFNLMATRTRRLSVFQHPPLFNKATQNLYLFPAILFALVVIFIFNYPEGLQTSLGTSPIPVEYWFLPMAFGLGLLGIDEARKAAVRRWPGGFLAKMAF